MKRVVGLDIETVDPLLGEIKSPSWIYDQGEILCVTLYENKKTRYIDWEKRTKEEEKDLKAILLGKENEVIGANIQYDAAWLEKHLNIQGKSKALFVDVLIAETFIDEYKIASLDSVSKKWLKVSKNKSGLEKWAEEKGLRGDFRKHLKAAPKKLLKEYALEDAKLPYFVWQKQKEFLEKDGQLEAVMRDFKMIPIVLMMTRNGIRVDEKAREKNRKQFEEALERNTKIFEEKYGKCNLGSSKQIASLFDTYCVPYKHKVTVKGKDGEKATGFAEKRKYFNEIKAFLPEIRFVKGEALLFIEAEKQQRVVGILEDKGYMVTSNPSIDSKALEAITGEYPVAQMIKDIKKLQSILSKVLGDNFARYIYKGRVHPSYSISKIEGNGTVSGRLSSYGPNAQQLPSKGKVFEGTEEELDIVAATRGTFLPEEGKVFFGLDYDQIEFKILSHVAVGPGSEEVRKRYNEDPTTDFHSYVMELTGLERKPAKTVNFGISFGLGKKSLAEGNAWSIEKAEDILNQYHENLPFVKATADKAQEVYAKRGYLTLIGGRKRHLENKDYAYRALNCITQGGGAAINKQALIDAYEMGIFDEGKLFLHMNIHDEVIGSVENTKEGMQLVKQLQQCMENPCGTKLKVPITAGPEIGKRWHQKIPLEEWLKGK